MCVKCELVFVVLFGFWDMGFYGMCICMYVLDVKYESVA